ncbi:hypothetical protein V6N13_061954 [Hibiscus sabdariffa]
MIYEIKVEELGLSDVPLEKQEVEDEALEAMSLGKDNFNECRSHEGGRKMGETYILGSLPNNVSKDDHMAWGNFNVIENIEEGSGIAGKTKKPSWVELVSNRLVENSDNNNIDIDLLIEVGKQELDRAWYDALNMRLLASNKDQDMMDVRGIPTRNDSSKKSLSWAAIVDERNKISMKSDSGKAKEATSMVETPSDVDEPKDFFPEMHIMTRNGEMR